MVLCSHVGSINFADPDNIRKGHKELMSQVRTKVIYISNKYNFQIEPIQLKWDKYLPNSEKDFPEILNEILSHNNNQQIPNCNENRNTPNEIRNQCQK